MTAFASWQGLRGAQLQKKFVLEGGSIQTAEWVDNAWNNVNFPNNRTYGYHYYIDLEQNFNAKTNNSILRPLWEATTGNPDAPAFLNGAFFHNGYQYWTYGGLADRAVKASSSKSLYNINLGKVYTAVPDNGDTSGLGLNNDPSFSSSAINASTFYAFPAYTSVPDQGLGFMFSGMTGAQGGPLEWLAGDTDAKHPTVTQPTFIKWTMSRDEANFEFSRWPDGVAARAEGGLVWLPYGSKGVLVALGGAVYPGDSYLLDAAVTITDADINNSFMTQLEIYDIAADAWYQKNTTAGLGPSSAQPPPTASFCTAVVPSDDGKSQQIIVYGGYDGTMKSTDQGVARDDVWVLSVPGFVWTKLNGTDSQHGRVGSVCIAPNPNTLITAGGTGSQGATLNSNTIIDVYDLNSQTWTSAYNASSTTTFQASPGLQRNLGWDGPGGPGSKYSTLDLGSEQLNTLFTTSYNTANLDNYYPRPYSAGTSPSGTNPTNGTNTNQQTSNHNKTVIIATTCTIIPLFVIAVLLAIFCIRRRRKNRMGGAQRQANQRNVLSWIGKDFDSETGQEKSQYSEETAVNSPLPYHGQPKLMSNDIHEAPATSGAAAYQRGQMSPGLSSTTAMSQNNNQTYEIMDNPRGSAPPPKDYPQYPLGIVGDGRSVHSDSLSSPAEIMSSQGTTSHRGVEHNDIATNGSHAPNDLRRDHNESVGGVSPTVSAVTPTGTNIPRKPVGSPVEDSAKSGHRRNMSSLSGDMPNLPSPGADEDKRQSRHVAALPDVPLPPVREVSRKGSGRMSAYRENFDEEMPKGK